MYSNINVGNEPNHCILFNFDNDGDLDLAIAKANTVNNLAILRNNGSGNYSLVGDYIVGGTSSYHGCKWLASGDINGDGREDLIVTNDASDMVYILRNISGSSFAAAYGYSAGSDPIGVIAKDLDRDGDIDIAVAECAELVGVPRIEILLNSGTGYFSSFANYQTSSEPYGLNAADFNSDGNIDLVTACNSSNSIAVLLNNGNATFSNPISYNAGSEPQAVFCADFDNDGDIDLASNNAGSANVSVFINLRGLPLGDHISNPIPITSLPFTHSCLTSAESGQIRVRN